VNKDESSNKSNPSFLSPHTSKIEYNKIFKNICLFLEVDETIIHYYSNLQIFTKFLPVIPDSLKEEVHENSRVVGLIYKLI